MKVYCTYDSKLNPFLDSVVGYTLNLFGDGLRLERLEEIELVKNIRGLQYFPDGRVDSGGKRIILTASRFDNLPVYDISQLQNNNDFKFIVSTLYHEMGHISDMTTMPRIYAAAQNFGNKWRMLAAFFWVEYLAEKRSSEANLVSNDDYLCDFVKRRWDSFKFNYSSASEDNYFYLCKTLSYYMGRTTKHKVREVYDDMMVNPLLQKFSNAVGEAIQTLEKRMPFDDISLLDNLSIIMGDYYEKFRQKYSQ